MTARLTESGKKWPCLEKFSEFYIYKKLKKSFFGSGKALALFTWSVTWSL